MQTCIFTYSSNEAGFSSTYFHTLRWNLALVHLSSTRCNGQSYTAINLHRHLLIVVTRVAPLMYCRTRINCHVLRNPIHFFRRRRPVIASKLITQPSSARLLKKIEKFTAVTLKQPKVSCADFSGCGLFPVQLGAAILIRVPLFPSIYIGNWVPIIVGRSLAGGLILHRKSRDGRAVRPLLTTGASSFSQKTGFEVGSSKLSALAASQSAGGNYCLMFALNACATLLINDKTNR